MGYGKTVKWENTLKVVPVSSLSSLLLFHINIALDNLLNFNFINLGFIFWQNEWFPCAGGKKEFPFKIIIMIFQSNCIFLLASQPQIECVIKVHQIAMCLSQNNFKCSFFVCLTFSGEKKRKTRNHALASQLLSEKSGINVFICLAVKLITDNSQRSVILSRGEGMPNLVI